MYKQYTKKVFVYSAPLIRSSQGITWFVHITLFARKIRAHISLRLEELATRNGLPPAKEDRSNPHKTLLLRFVALVEIRQEPNSPS